MSREYTPRYDDLPPSYEQSMSMPTNAAEELLAEADGAPPPYDLIQHSNNYARIDVSTPARARFSYADFYPKILRNGTAFHPPVYDSFRNLVSTANQWLNTVDGYRVCKCETVEKKLGKKFELDAKSTACVESAFGTNMYLTGLRVWLLPCTVNLPRQSIDYANVVPELQRSTNHSVFFGVHSGQAMHKMLFKSFESCEKVLERYNAVLHDSPINGSPLNFETVEMKISEEFTQQRNLDPDKTFRIEMGYTCKLYLLYFRLFYIRDNQQTITHIEVKDFKPNSAPVTPGLISRPKFEPYGDLFQKAADWIQQQQTDTCVISIETVDAQLQKYRDQITVNTSSMLKDQSSYVDNLGVKVIRVAYTHTSSTHAHTPCPHTPLAQQRFSRVVSKAFVPERVSRLQFEDLPSTVYRIDCWLQLTGVRVLGMDTINVEFHPDSKSVRTERVSQAKYYGQSRHMVSTIRLYLDGEYSEPDPSYLPAKPQYRQHHDTTSSTHRSTICTIT